MKKQQYRIPQTNVEERVSFLQIVCATIGENTQSNMENGSDPLAPAPARSLYVK